MVITKEETFGPVAPLYRFKNDADDAVFERLGDAPDAADVAAVPRSPPSAA